MQTLQHVRGAVAFSYKVYKISYLYSKKQAYINFKDNQQQSYKVREQHYLFIKAIKEIVQQQQQQQEEESVIEEEDFNKIIDSNRDIIKSGKDDKDLYKIIEANRKVVNKQDVQQQLLLLLLLLLLLPYYVFSFKDIFAFLQVQLNCYYFLFEYVYA